MKTADIQKWLATDPRAQSIVRGRVGQNDDGTWDEGEAPEDEMASDRRTTTTYSVIEYEVLK